MPIRRAGALAFVIVVLGLAVGCGGSGDGRHDLEGEVSLNQAAVSSGPDDCSGTGRYQRINASTEVLVKDENGAEIGVGTLGAGEATRSGCRFEYEVENLPRVEEYTVEIRGFASETYTFGEMNSRDWQVDFEIGE